MQEARGSSKCLAAIYFVSLAASAADDAAADADAVHRREHQQNVIQLDYEFPLDSHFIELQFGGLFPVPMQFVATIRLVSGFN